MEYKEVQKIAKDTIEYAKKNIYAGMSLIEIREMCERKMLELGADSFWYWDIGAFVFAGDETTISVSGTKYKTSDRVILENDIITIDLSPQRENIWGDYARTLIIENGIVVDDEFASNEEWKNGVHMEKQLHKEMMHFVTPNTTFEELYYYMNKVIEDSGYINLDFMGNLGHSIVKQKNDRIYIEKGNKSKLDDVALFTFEPHISISGSKYGYKRENIYYFEDAIVVDKVIGKATAMLLILSKVKYIYAYVLSEKAKEILEYYHISYDCEKVVPYIINRTHDGMCPMEKTVYDMNDLDEAFIALKHKQSELMKQ